MSFSTILHKRNSTQGVVPSAPALSAGEIAINTADGKFFTKTTSNEVKTFLNSEQLPYSLDQSLSSVNYQYGESGVSGVLSVVLGGVSNSVSGAGSTIANGSDNDIAADYSFIGNGSNNTIDVEGDFGAIVGGQNNTLSHSESFILGSNISSHLSGFTYVNNLSATGKLYGDGSELTGIVAGDIEATTLVRAESANWGTGGTSQTVFYDESTYDLSLSYGNTVSLSSLAGGSEEYLPLSGGNLTGSLSAEGSRVITSSPDNSTPIFNIRVLSQASYDAIVTKDPNTLYFIDEP